MLALLLSIGASPAWPADAVRTKRFALAGRGFLELRVPSAWIDIVRQPGAGASATSPTIGFWPAQGRPFEITLTPHWPSPANARVPPEQYLREHVEGYALAIKDHAVEQKIGLVRLAGRSGPGFYLSATDKAPGPGEYRFVTQGALKVGELTLTFTILTNEGQSAVVAEALDMVRRASYSAR